MNLDRLCQGPCAAAEGRRRHRRGEGLQEHCRQREGPIVADGQRNVGKLGGIKRGDAYEDVTGCVNRAGARLGERSVIRATYRTIRYGKYSMSLTFGLTHR